MPRVAAEDCGCTCGRCCEHPGEEHIKGDDALDGSSSGGGVGSTGYVGSGGDASGSRSGLTVGVRAAPGEGGEMAVEGLASSVNFDYPVTDRHGTFTERLAPGAFAGVGSQDVIFQIDHAGMPLARTPATMTVWESPAGLRCRAVLSDTQVGRDAYETIRRGDISKMSFGFVVGKDSWSSDCTRRLITRVDRVVDVSGVGFPCNPNTWISVVGADTARTRERAWATRRLNQLRERVAA